MVPRLLHPNSLLTGRTLLPSVRLAAKPVDTTISVGGRLVPRVDLVPTPAALQPLAKTLCILILRRELPNRPTMWATLTASPLLIGVGNTKLTPLPVSVVLSRVRSSLIARVARGPNTTRSYSQTTSGSSTKKTYTGR